MKNIIKSDIYRILCGWRFPLSIILMFWVWYFNCQRFEQPQDVLFLFLYTKGLSITTLLGIEVAAFVFSGTYCEDYENNELRYILLRISLKKYVFLKIIVCFFAGFFVYVAGSLLFIYVQSINLPIVAASSVAVQNFKTLSCFGYLLPDSPVMFMGLQVIMDGICCAMLGTLTMALSVYLPNAYIVLALPLVIYYFLYYFLGYILKVPEMFDLELTFRSCITYTDSRCLFLLYALFVTAIYLLFSMFLMYQRIRRDYR